MIGRKQALTAAKNKYVPGPDVSESIIVKRVIHPPQLILLIITGVAITMVKFLRLH